MNKIRLDVQMFGKFSITCDANCIDNRQNRSEKVWLLLACLFFRHRQTVPQDELIKWLWYADEDNRDSANALKAILHRARNQLDLLSPGLGRALICSSSRGYYLSPDFDIRLDTDEFDELDDELRRLPPGEDRLPRLLRALELYQGEFLPWLKSNFQVMPLNAYYRDHWRELLIQALPLLQEQAQHQQIETQCARAMLLEPADETLCSFRMQALIALQRNQEAVEVYNAISRQLMDVYGIIPPDPLRALYRQAIRTTNDRSLETDELMEQLQETDPRPGALICDYDYFKFVYRATARSVVRSGIAAHVGIISVINRHGAALPLPKRSLETCMDNLDQLLRQSLRHGDTAAQCSASQYVLLLCQANYENSVMVLDRITRRFNQLYPHSPAYISGAVRPLRPLR